MKDQDRVIFHIDVNSAFLSFEAVYRLQQGQTLDLREIPSAVGGSQATRHGIIPVSYTHLDVYKRQFL